MSKAVLTVLVMLGVLGSPMTRELCLIRCASPSAHGSGSAAADHAAGSDHACHDAGTSSSPAIGGLPHGCEHDSPDVLSTTTVSAVEHRCAPALVCTLPVSAATSSATTIGLAWWSGPDPAIPPIRPLGAPLPLRI